jgi:anti-sigma-K factor RskA
VLLGVGYYAYTLQADLTAELGSRKQLEAALHDESRRVDDLKRQISEQEQAVAALKAEFTDRSGDTAQLKETLAARDQEAEQTRRQLTQREQELTALRKSLSQRDDMVTLLRSAHARVSPLAGSERAPTAGGLLLFDPEIHKALFYAFNLPALPPGKTYQLWAISDKPLAAGTFTIDSGNKARLLIKVPSDWSALPRFAVSLEPEGGRPQPSGELYLVSSL